MEKLKGWIIIVASSILIMVFTLFIIILIPDLVKGENIKGESYIAFLSVLVLTTL